MFAVQMSRVRSVSFVGGREEGFPSGWSCLRALEAGSRSARPRKQEQRAGSERGARASATMSGSEPGEVHRGKELQGLVLELNQALWVGCVVPHGSQNSACTLA